jgi:hypothetical protein
MKSELNKLKDHNRVKEGVYYNVIGYMQANGRY